MNSPLTRREFAKLALGAGLCSAAAPLRAAGKPNSKFAGVQIGMNVPYSFGGKAMNADEVYDEWGFAASPSRGQVALFSGPSGTGKTLAAEIIAGELGLDLFKLDLSAVVSKWIGETEKNLDRIFRAAESGNYGPITADASRIGAAASGGFAMR